MTSDTEEGGFWRLMESKSALMSSSGDNEVEEDMITMKEKLNNKLVKDCQVLLTR